jgi:tetratricopeptide (TPR) repeat protein
MRILILCALLLLFPGTARAEWREAASAHFVVYANDNETNLRRFSERLERFHSAMNFITNAQLAVPSPSNRVTVYVVSGETEVRKLYGSKSANVGAFYIPRAGGSIAIVPRVEGSSGTDLDWTMTALLHEYAHHFLISMNSYALPRWLSEGQAEYYASASFDRDGSVALGRAAMHRGPELFLGRDVKAGDLIDSEAYDKRCSRGCAQDAFYGKSWLLYHYMVMGGQRKGQLEKYLAGLIAGKKSREAGLEAFGDFAVLEKDLDSYLNKSRIMMYRIPANRIEIGQITTRLLRPGEAAMMPIMIRSRRGVDETTAPQVLADARAVGLKFPTDPAVLSALAEAEHDAGNDDAAIKAADQALAADAGQVNAYIQKGYALFRMAEKSSDPADYRKARAPFIALNRRESDHPLPLIFFYRSFQRQGTPPTPLAIQGLEPAVELAPFDQGIRMTLAMQYVRDKQRDKAIRNLRPIAYYPHQSGLATAAQKVLARFESDPNWDGTGIDSDNATIEVDAN